MSGIGVQLLYVLGYQFDDDMAEEKQGEPEEVPLAHL